MAGCMLKSARMPWGTLEHPPADWSVSVLLPAGPGLGCVAAWSHVQALSRQQVCSVARQLSFMLRRWPLSFFFTPSDFLCQVYNLPYIDMPFSQVYFAFPLHCYCLICFPFPLMLIYSYIAVLQMGSQRPSQLMSISSKYPSLPAAHGDGAVLPSILTGVCSFSALPFGGPGRVDG